MNKPTLLILAAGLGSRYGGVKQIDQFGPNGETIIDYSIFDAINSGFDKIVFVIREDFADEFKAIFKPKLRNSDIEVVYVYQKLSVFLGAKPVPAKREKPWGTAHALLCAKDVINEPFAIINADDFYGKEPFEMMAEFLNLECNETHAALMGYEIENTLSPNGPVSRGVCETNDHGNLKSITELTRISARRNNIISTDNNGKNHIISTGTLVSMNFWGFDPSVFDLTEKMFDEFLEENINNPESEFLIPSVADYYIANSPGTIKVIPTSEHWFGITYREDAPAVKENLKRLIENGIYSSPLWT